MSIEEESIEISENGRSVEGSSSGLDSSYNDSSEGEEEKPGTQLVSREVSGDVALTSDSEETDQLLGDVDSSKDTETRVERDDKNGEKNDSQSSLQKDTERVSGETVHQQQTALLPSPKESREFKAVSSPKASKTKERGDATSKLAKVSATKAKRTKDTPATKESKTERKHERCDRKKSEIPTSEEMQKYSATKSDRRKTKLNKEEQKDSTQVEQKQERKKAVAKTDKGRKGNVQSEKKKAAQPSTPRTPSRKSTVKDLTVSPSSFSPISPGSPSLRRPPGLAPPPGFGSATSQSPSRTLSASSTNTPALLLTRTISNDEPLLTLADLNSGASRTGNVVTGTPLGASPRAIGPPRLTPSTDSIDLVPSLGTLLPAPAVPSIEHERRNSMSDFDVMDFLDGILNEGSTSPEDEAADSSGIFRETSDQIGSGGPHSPSFMPLSSNPWATSTTSAEAAHRSRAAAYGISFEDHSSSQRTLEEAENVNLPLLTPAAIFSSVAEGESEDKNTNSFYSSLLG
jgi:hypothetical protein